MTRRFMHARSIAVIALGYHTPLMFADELPSDVQRLELSG